VQFRKSPILSFLLTAFVVACFALPVSAQQGWSIIGTVQTSHGELPDRRILLTLQFRGSTIATTYCDSEGKFFFSELSANVYHVLVDDEKYQRVEELAQINPMSTGPTFVRIILVPREAAKLGSPPPGSNPNMVNSSEFTRQVTKPAIKEFRKAVDADKDGQTDDAIAHYKKAISLAPDFYAARNNLGSAYLAKSQFSAAQEQFEQVIKTNPSDAAAYFNLGNVFLVTEKYEEAARWLDQGISKQPKSPLGHFLLGSLYTRTGRGEEAEKELQACLELDPKMLKAHLGLVNLFLQRDRPGDAVIHLKQFLKDGPDDPFAPKAREVLKRLEAKTQHR
jgi:Flp pilus assembly protein TadD